MCNFFSALALPNGDIRWHWALDSHSDLLTYFGIKDESGVRNFAKVELVPGDDWTGPDSWVFKLDEETAPQWWSDVAGVVERAMRSAAKKFILKDTKKRLIVDGVWVVAGSSEVCDVRGGRIIRVQDSATVSGVGGSATVSGVGDSATVRDVGGSATVRDVWDSATVSGVGDSATVRDVWDSATVRDVGGSATVRDVGDSATVRDVGPKCVLDDSAKAALAKK